MYVKVLGSKCCGYTVCADLCPEIFKLDDQGFAYVEDAAVPAGLELKATDAAKGCPEAAIVVSDAPFE